MGLETDPQLKDRVGRLMAFLRDLVAARTHPVRDIGSHERVVWPLAVRDVYFDEQAMPGSTVLRANRVTLAAAPAVPVDLRPWLLQSRYLDSSREAPELRRDRLEPDPDTGGNRPMVPGDTTVDSYQRWRRLWMEWARTDQIHRPRHDLYQDLLAMRQALNERPESVEVVLAAGLLHLPVDVAGDRFRTHVLTQTLDVQLDERTGDLLCVLPIDSSPRLEDSQLLTGLPAFDPSGSNYFRSQLSETVPSLAAPTVITFLKEWAERALTVDVEVSAGVGTGAPSTLTTAPGIVLRRRGSAALLEFYERIIAASEKPGSVVPLGLAQLVDAIEPDERVAWLERTGATAAASLADDPLFPLPANPEQAQIIERLGRDSGVVVEGPPGTGKTHTIANLMSALLAQGQRVLVTSEKAQALRVLREKLPLEMQELCVSITDIARGGSAELSRSVATLAARKSGFNAASETRRIDDLMNRRAQAKQERATVLEEIRALRESETYQHPVIADGYAGTAAAIARSVRAGVDRHGWVPRPASGEPPLTVRELSEMADRLGSVSAQRLSRREQVLPETSQLPEIDSVLRLCATVGAAPTANESADELTRALAVRSDTELSQLADLCRRVGTTIAELRRPATPPWAENVANDLLAGRNAYLWEQARQVGTAADRARLASESVGTHIVGAPPGLPLTTVTRAFREYADHLAAGGTFRRFLKSDEQKTAEPFLAVVTVDGRPAFSWDQMEQAAAHFESLEAVQQVAALLLPLGGHIPAWDHRPSLVGAALEAAAIVAAIQRIAAVVGELRALLAHLVPRPPTLHDLRSAEQFADRAAALSAAYAGKVAAGQLVRMANDLRTRFRDHRSPEFDRLTAAMDDADASAVAAAYIGLEDARRQQTDQKRCDELADRLRAANPPMLTLLSADPGAAHWPDRVQRWPESWAWAVAETWLQRSKQPGREQQLEELLRNVDDRLSHITAQLAAAMAWVGALERMNARQMQALQSYRDNLANVGMGTGKYAEQFRQAARSAMRDAQGAVPAWVMPIQQVLASLPPTQNMFDVVIVDEASQADITSLFLLWLAPRVIVVGDDKQCTPSEVSSGTLEGVFSRLESFLPDMPLHLRSTLTPRSSVFSMLRTRFGQVVRLREHFRCMPEIINWSSSQFYRDSPLVPVRQFGASRLPPLKTTYVEGASVTGSGAKLHNLVEAQAIAEALLACLDDAAYDGKTLGVVVLQGQAQVDVIRNELLERIDPEVWEKRRLRIGTPPDFQGDERHVVFLSMVVAPEMRFQTLTRNEFQRRFNVAASRAQDQLWLFHSVTADRLNPIDLRHSLLTYMRAAPSSVAPVLTDVAPDRPHPKFDSLFEQRVFLEITARGYHVTPQVEVNSRRIDLVVTGAAAKLAVECDGDAWHTSPEQRDADMARELELKRCGWQFWRLRESEYYLDPIASLSSLWTTLDARGIGPRSVPQDGIGGTTEPWTPAALPDDETADEEESEAEDTDDVAIRTAPSTRPAAESPRLLGATAPPPIVRTTEVINRSKLPAVPVSPTTAVTTADPEDPDTPLRGPSVPDLERFVNPVLTAVAQSRRITNPGVRELTGLDLVGARSLLQLMVLRGLLHRHGKTRGTYYTLPGAEEVDDEHVEPRDVAGLVQQVLELAQRQAFTKKDLYAATGCSRGEASEVLRMCVAQGLLSYGTEAGDVVYLRTDALAARLLGSAQRQAGWYPDPDGMAPYRYWDGEAWTSRIRM